MAIDAKSFTSLKWYYQIAIVAALCGSLLGLGWYYFIEPVQEDIAKKQTQLNDLQKEVARSLQQKKVFEQFKADVQDLSRKLEDLKSVLPLEKETPQIIDSIRKEAAARSVNIARISPRPLIDHDIYTEWPWDMEVSGTYNNLGLFLDQVRQLPRIVSVSGLKVTSKAAEGEKAATASIAATYVVTTYIYHEQPVQTTAPKPGK